MSPTSVVNITPAPESCARLEQLVAQWGGSMTWRSTDTRVNYTVPPHASAELREFFRPQADVALEPEYLAYLPGGRVFDSVNVLSPDGRVIARDVSPDFGKPFSDHWLLTYKRMSPVVPLRGTTAAIATTLGAGYSHWLLDELPRLLALNSDACETLIAHVAAPRNREAFALHGFTGQVNQLNRYTHFACERLIVPSPSQMTPATVRALEEFTAPLRTPSGAAFGERLYISRAKARRRTVVNEAELWAELSSRGFVKLHLEELTWQEQINAFRGAKIIVAPHGAGLANLVFCAAGTKVIELFHREYVNGCYWRLAALKGLDYRPLVPVVADEPLAQTLRAGRLDIETDLRQLAAAL